jgi:hypothetical protein
MNLQEAAHQAAKQAFDKGLTVFEMRGSYLVEVDGSGNIISGK